MVERDVLFGEIDTFLCEGDGEEQQLDRWQCHHLVRAIAYIDTLIEAHLGIGLCHKAKVPESGRFTAEVDEVAKDDILPTLAEARASFEEARKRPLREL